MPNRITSDFRSKLSAKIIELRTEQKMTSEQLSLKIGLSKAGLRYIEMNLKDPRIGTLNQIANGLKVPLMELIDFKSN